MWRALIIELHCQHYFFLNKNHLYSSHIASWDLHYVVNKQNHLGIPCTVHSMHTNYCIVCKHAVLNIVTVVQLVDLMCCFFSYSDKVLSLFASIHGHLLIPNQGSSDVHECFLCMIWATYAQHIEQTKSISEFHTWNTTCITSSEVIDINIHNWYN